MPKVVCMSLNAEEGPHWKIFEEAGWECSVAPRDRDYKKIENVIEVLADAEAVVAGAEPYPEKVITSLPKLRAIGRTGVGFDAIDLAACDDAGVVVTTTPGVNHHSVAEHTIAMLMAVSRDFPERDIRVRECRWKRVATPRVMGRTIGILGLGRIGRAVATRAHGLGMKILAYDPYPNREFVEQWGVTLCDLPTILSQSDYVSLHLPATPETTHLINAETLQQMKSGAILINTARGSLVDEPALVEALQNGHLGGAGLDVFEVEPLPASSPLLKMNNVLLSGHVAGLDQESHDDTFTMVARILLDLYNGGWPVECIQNLKGATTWLWQRG
mgnify:FL=1